MINITKKVELTGHLAAIYALCPEDERFVFSGGVDKHVIRWDINNIENSKILIKSTETIYSLYFYKDKNLLFIGTSSGKIHIIDLFQKKEIKLLKAHTDKIFDFKLLDSFLISVSADGYLAFTNLDSLKTEYILKVSNERIRPIEGIKEIQNNVQVDVYPNPTSELVFVNVVSSGKIESIELTNIVGELIMNVKPVSGNETKAAVNFSGYAEGTYIMKVKTYTGSLIKKIVITGN